MTVVEFFLLSLVAGGIGATIGYNISMHFIMKKFRGK